MDETSENLVGGRSRRSTVKAINYAKEQEFSDQEMFGDESEEEVVQQPVKRGRGRKSKSISNASAPVSRGGDEEHHHHHADDIYGSSSQQQRPAYTEKGYDSSLQPIRERFPFLPEFEEDGSPKIELIVGRRPVDEKEDAEASASDDDEMEIGEKADVDGEDISSPKTRGSRRSTPLNDQSEDNVEKSSKKKIPVEASPGNTGPVVEYEYLVKFKGRSYLHLEWKTGADLESMNKSAKGIYRRYLKKLGAGTDEELESPDFDPSFIVPEKVLDEADQEITVELTHKELLKWEKEREKELKALKDDDESEDSDEENVEISNDQMGAPGDEKTNGENNVEEKKDDMSVDSVDDWPDEIEFKNFDLTRLRRILRKEGSYYPIVAGCDNPYRDGYVTEPPKKPRASYLFFQATLRSYFAKKHPSAVQAELMGMLGEAWRSMDEIEKKPFQILADEESKQYDKERVLLEKAQKPNGVWQPLRRCRQVLDRLAGDSFAEIFLEPVDTKEFPDYEEHIDVPMDLGTVRERIENRKYIAPEQFARDMRRIWNNCKIYNQHGSAIWHVADYMSKQFERLYHAWVLEFRERYIRWADPRARPWEHTCRVHDGKCGTQDDKMVLCDHCDAMYGFQCLTPPLKKAPTKAWHCPDCKPKLKTAKGARMLSAVAESAARKRAEFGDIPKKKITRTMYLVKWAGLGYEFCTWETKEDIGNDKLISEFHKINHGFSDEADMQEEVIKDYFKALKHVNEENAGGNGLVPHMRAQLYAQSRGLQFLKFGMEVPPHVGQEMGPKTIATQRCPRFSYSCGIDKYHPRDVIECIQDLVYRTELHQQPRQIRSNTFMPPPLTGEYDVIVPITANGLMMNVGEMHGSVCFLGYRKFPDGTKGPAERAKLIRNTGDKIVAVDGISTVGKSFKDVIEMLRESGKNKFAYMRFLENKYAVCDDAFSSVGMKGSYAFEELQKKLRNDRQYLMVQRTASNIGDDPLGVEKVGDASAKSADSDDESIQGSEGSFLPSDDEELVGTVNVKEISPSGKKEKDGEVTEVTLENEKNKVSEFAIVASENAEHTDAIGELPIKKPEVEIENIASNVESVTSDVKMPTLPAVLCREETTRSLALRLLDVDLGYSSDEAGDESCAFFVDGVDDTFTCKNNCKDCKDSSVGEPLIPANKTEFSALGDRGKLAAAVALTTVSPCEDDFTEFPKTINDQEIATHKSPSSSTKRSTVKVEQISVSTSETVHVWANVESAAATLQLPLPQLRQVLRGEYDEDIGEEIGGFRWRYALTGAKVTAGNISTTQGGGGKKAKEAWLEFREKLYDPSEPHVYKNGNRLRDYQVDGVNWLASTWYKRQGCILADEMGLGKTVQIVCYIEHLFRVEKIRRPYLVVVPLSTVGHWRREFQAWTDLVCCIYHDRQRVWRDVMREYEWYFEDRPHNPDFLKFDVLVTTYDTLIADFDVISQIPFRVAVVDEAHRLRNQKGKLLECMREISAKGTMHYGFQSRVLMSGTPLQNDLTELWTLLNFIEPFKFQELDDFQAKFGSMSNRSQVESLQQMISPYMLRRVKEDVAKDIPAKEETVIDVELTAIQKTYYRAIFEHNHAFLSIGATRQCAPKLMNIQMELRKVCNHPFLLDGIEHRETDRLFKELLEKGAFDGKTPEEQQHLINEHGYIMTSGKMVLLDKLLPKLKQEGHKVLVFSQMVKMIDLISEYCEFRDFRYERLDGRIRGTDRQKAIDRFNIEKDSFLFLLSTRAGGVGINLTAADICIIFDSDWNPQNDIQAQARCHRIGQTKDVRIYRLITSRSFEQEMFERASKKLGLEQAVLGTFEKDGEDDKPTQQEMEQLLKRGAYALLEDDNDEVTRQFCADDIDSILAKRTRTRVVEGAKTASWLSKQGMVVSKTKFSSEADGGLDMDDPQFWQKVMPNFVTPSLLLQKLRELEYEIEGKVGRGRGRWKKKLPKRTVDALDGERSDLVPIDENSVEKEDNDTETLERETGTGNDAASGEENDIDEDDDAENDEENEDNKKKGKVIRVTRTQQRKIQKFMSDLKSLMESLDEDEEDEGLSADEREVLQKVLLTVSVKQKFFTDEQRRIARRFLKFFEGDRRRRCRTSDAQRFQPGSPGDDIVPTIREELLIRGKKRKKRRKRTEDMDIDEEPARKKIRRSSDAGGYLGEDGYLHHSDSGEDWSDVGEGIYDSGGKKDIISRKEAARRRKWTAGDDAATAAGRAWPVFPRSVVKQVLSSLIDEVIEYDKNKGGLFSVPVSKDEFPEYYEQIKRPMDYATMKEKLENGGYRSAQAMQKDFILILQNCREFNDASSEIVKEAREQHLLRPKLLIEAAANHNLFLAEDGSVLEIFDEKSKSPRKANGKKKETENETPKKRHSRKETTAEQIISEVDAKKSLKGKKKPKELIQSDDENKKDGSKNKKNPPRIQIKVKLNEKKKGTKGKRVESADVNENEVDDAPTPLKKRKKNETLSSKKKLVKKSSESETSSDDDVPLREVAAKTRTPTDRRKSKFLDLKLWEQRRKNLNGSFASARKNFVCKDGWDLPPGIPSDKFTDVANLILDKMERHDRYSVFEDKVTDEEAPGYSEVVTNPMDFGTMRKKVANGEYGNGNKAVKALYEDFKLVFDNCYLYNDEGNEVTDEASRILGLLPEAYVSACLHVLKKSKK